MKIYLQVNESGVITDAITYKHGNYIEHEVTSIPTGISGGWFKFENGQIIEYLELKPIQTDEEIQKIKDRLDLMQPVIDEMILGGGL